MNEVYFMPRDEAEALVKYLDKIMYLPADVYCVVSYLKEFLEGEE